MSGDRAYVDLPKLALGSTVVRFHSGSTETRGGDEDKPVDALETTDAKQSGDLASTRRSIAALARAAHPAAPLGNTNELRPFLRD